MSDTEHEHEATVATVSVKLRPSDPEIWFAQVEATFTTRRITSQKTRFDFVATETSSSGLQPPHRTQPSRSNSSAVLQPPNNDVLFNAEELGDRRPTQLLRRMQQLLGDRASVADSTFLRELFLQRLPSNVRMVLASTSPTATLDEIAELADKIVEVATPSTTAHPFPELLTEIEQLRAEVQKLQTSPTSRPLSFLNPAQSIPIAGITKSLVITQRNALHLATMKHSQTSNSQTSRPAVSGVWPQHMSSIAHHRTLK